jgi:hypothetical protein
MMTAGNAVAYIPSASQARTSGFCRAFMALDTGFPKRA